MCPSQDPTVNERVLLSHPYLFDPSQPPSPLEPPKVLAREGGLIFPPEIWAAIFKYCMPDPPLPGTSPPWYNRDRQINALIAPLLLCQICRVWRYIAISLPQLWQHLTVYASLGSACPAAELVEVWLSRSGSLPLSLSLHQQNESNLNRLVAGRILQLFMRHLPRWMDIDLHLAGPRLAINLAPEQRAAPMLQQFKMRTSYRVYEKEERCIFGIFEDVPRLSNLHVSRLPDLDLLGNCAIGVRWAQLTSLSLDYVPSIGTSLHILSKCENLIECTMKIDALFGPLLDEPLVHPLLQSLSINASYEHFPAFLPRITLPALKRLAIHVRGPLEQYGWPQYCFDEFLKRSSCKLTQLELHDSGLGVDQFISTLRQPCLQTLEELIIDDRRDWTWDPFVTDVAFDLLNCSLFKYTYAAIATLDGDSIFHESAAVADRVCFLPKLGMLVVRGNCLRTTDGTIANMVESRRRRRDPSISQFKNLKLEIPSSHITDIQRLKLLQTGGLDLELSFI